MLPNQLTDRIIRYANPNGWGAIVTLGTPHGPTNPNYLRPYQPAREIARHSRRRSAKAARGTAGDPFARE
jgi:hypothetical protein